MERIELASEVQNNVEVDALLGAALPPKIKLSDMMEKYEEFVVDRLRNKTNDQLRRWRAPRIKAVQNLIKTISDEALENITRQQALEFRAWWWKRIQSGEVSVNSGNKDMTYLSAMFKEVSQALGQDWRNPFQGLRFREEKAHRLAFSESWIRTRLLAFNALDGLNDEARAVFLLMINTGARPSELIGLLPEHVCFDNPIPHIKIRAEGRELKTKYSERDLPLVGVSLFAMRSFPNRLISRELPTRERGDDSISKPRVSHMGASSGDCRSLDRRSLN